MCGAGFTGPLKALFQSKAYLRRLALAIMLFACQNGTGINAINYYSPASLLLLSGTSGTLLTIYFSFLDRFQVYRCQRNQHFALHDWYLRYHQVPGRHRLAYLARGSIWPSNNAVRRKYWWSHLNVRHRRLYRYRPARQAWKQL